MSAKGKASVRITDQYRDRDVIVYELSCEGTRLAVRFLPRPPDGEGAAWTVDVRTNERENSVIVTGAGDTRAAALREAGGAWANALRSRPYPAFEWNAISEALEMVKAL